MTLREAFVQARSGAPPGWLLVRWPPDMPCALDAEAQFVELPLEGAARGPVVPQTLLDSDWTPVSESWLAEAIVRQADALSGCQDDAACWEALLIHDLERDARADALSYAVQAAVARRRRLGQGGAGSPDSPGPGAGRSERAGETP